MSINILVAAFAAALVGAARNDTQKIIAGALLTTSLSAAMRHVTTEAPKQTTYGSLNQKGNNDTH